MHETTDITAYLRELIVTGRTATGAFLRLDPVAAELGVSVTPVREALFRLEAEGFVDHVPRRGFRVLPLTDDDVRDVYLVQAMIAAELAARATRTLSARDVDDLGAIQDELEAAHARGESAQVEACNHRFHRLINRSVGAPWLAQQLGTSARFAPRRFFAAIDGWPEASATEHRAIIDALRSSDPAAAGEAMRRHIVHAGELLAAHRHTATEEESA